MMRGMRGRAAAWSRPSLALAPRCSRPRPRRRPGARRFPAHRAVSSRPTTSGTWTSPSSRSPRRARSGRRSMHAGSTLLHPDFGPPALRHPVRRRGRLAPDGARRLRLRRRERSRPVPVRARHPRRGRVRPARDHDRPRHVHAVRAVRRGVERRRARRPAAARSSTWTAERERPAAGDVDVGRRGRAADLPGPRPLGRGATPARSITRSGSRSTAPASTTCGRRVTRPGAATAAARRWARGSA